MIHLRCVGSRRIESVAPVFKSGTVALTMESERERVYVVNARAVALGDVNDSVLFGIRFDDGTSDEVIVPFHAHASEVRR
jgi:hypothetical protein